MLIEIHTEFTLAQIAASRSLRVMRESKWKFNEKHKRTRYIHLQSDSALNYDYISLSVLTAIFQVNLG